MNAAKEKPRNRHILALRIATDFYEGRPFSVDDLYKQIKEHDGPCNEKTARKIFNDIATGFIGSSSVKVKTWIERRGEKKIPVTVMSVIIGKS